MQPFTVGTKWHIALTFVPNANGDGKGHFYWSKTDMHGGNHRESSALTANTFDFQTWGMDGFYLGRSYWAKDFDAEADYDEVRIWNVALTPEQLVWSARLGAETLPTAAAAGAETAAIGVAADEGGRILVNGNDAGSAGSVNVAKNELVTLTAVPDADYHFHEWTGDIWAIQSGAASDAAITVYAASAASFTASFRQNSTTWTGAGANNLWSTAANWQDALLPVEHARVVFNGNVQTTNENDLLTVLDKLTFGVNAAAHTLTGNALTLGALENFSAATQTVDLAVSAAAAFSVTNSGTLVFRGGFNAGTDVYFRGGTTCLGGSSSVASIWLNSNGTTLTFDGEDTAFTAAQHLSGAYCIGTGESTTINIKGGTLSVGGNLATECTEDGSPANVGGNGTINQSGGDVTVAKYFLVGRDHEGTYNLTGGTLTQTDSNYEYVLVGERKGSSGTFNISGNSNFSCAGNAYLGQAGTGVMNVSGGEATFQDWLSIGVNSTGVGTLNVTGGNVMQTRVDRGLVVGGAGKATVNISGDAVVDVAGSVAFSKDAANVSGVLNLTDGGTLVASSIKLVKPSPFASMYVNDATLVARGICTTLNEFIDMPYLTVGPKGMTLDTQDNTVVLRCGFDFGRSAGGITKVGSGTLCMPGSSDMPIKVLEGTLAGQPPAADGSNNGVLAARLIHRWSFNGDFVDSVGGLDATSKSTKFVDNAVRTIGGGSATSYVNLNPEALPKDGPFTIEIFATPRRVYNWSRIFSFGKGVQVSSPRDNFFMSWTSETDLNRDRVYLICNNGVLLNVDDTVQPFTLGTKWHIVLSYVPNLNGDGKGCFYWSKMDMNGGNHRESFALTSSTFNMQTWGVDGFFLGLSYWAHDFDAEADYDEVRVWRGVLNREQLMRSVLSGPDVLPTLSSDKISAVDLAAGTSFTTLDGEVAVGKMSGTGTVTGALAVMETLDIAGEEVGTMTLNGDLAVKGTWLLDMDALGCDQLTGTGTLDISQATIAVRDLSKLRGGCVLATVGAVIGSEQAAVDVKGHRLSFVDGRLMLVSNGLCIFIR